MPLSWFTLLAVSILCLFAAASPALEARAKSTCKVKARGYLSTSELRKGNDDDSHTGKWKYFSFNSKHELSYYNTTKPHILAEFQTCAPNYGGYSNHPDPRYPDSATYFGRVYIPSLKKCLAVENPSSRIGPYFVQAKSCEPTLTTGSASIPFNFKYSKFYSIQPNTFFLFWLGRTRHDGVNNQGQCESGSHGYEHDDYHIPTTGGPKDPRIRVSCDMAGNSGPFAELRAK